MTRFLAVSTVAALLGGCTAVPLSEASNPAFTQTAKPAGSVPELTTPSYHTPTTPEKDDTYTPEYQLKLLANRDFGGNIFLIVREKNLENGLFPLADDLTESYAEDRNTLVGSKYNVELACISKTADEILDELSKAVASGNYFADLLVVSPALFKQLKEKNLLQSLNHLPFFETDSVYLSQDAIAEINSGWTGTYGVWGDALRQPSQGYALYYALEQAEALGCPNFYGKVQNGSFDIHTLLDAAAKGKLAFDGNPADLLFALTGINSATDEGKALLESDSYTALLSKFEESRYVSQEETALDAFLGGKALFYIGKLGTFPSFAQTELKVGILPLPKYNANDAKYPHPVDQSTLPILACPLNMTSLEGSGILLSAFNAASCDQINDIFLQSLAPHVRDNGSTLMLPYLVDSIQVDRKLIYGE